MALLIAFAGCSESGQAEDDVNTFPAGNRARSMGIESYRVAVVGEHMAIDLIGLRDFDIGELELAPVAVGETGLDGEIQTDELVATTPQVRVRYRTRQSTTDIGVVRVRMSEHDAGPDTSIPVSSVWQAALTDPELRPLLRERGIRLVAISSEEQAAYDERREAASSDEVGYYGEWPCFHHRINAHPSGWEFWGCGGYHDNEYPVWGRYCPYGGYQAYWVHRTCDDNCCNLDCENPAPGAVSSGCQQAGYGNAGCRTEADGWFEDVDCQEIWCDGNQCSAYCTDGCGDYQPLCCF